MIHPKPTQPDSPTQLFEIPTGVGQPRHRHSLLERAGFFFRGTARSLSQPKGSVLVLALVTAAAGWQYFSTQFFVQNASITDEQNTLAQEATAGASSTVPTQSVTLQTAEQIAIAETLSLTGNVVPKSLLSVTPALSGLNILEMRAEAGDYVDAGQVLAVLDDRSLQATLRQAEAKLAQAQANLQRQYAVLAQADVLQQAAIADMDRYRQLYQQGAISRVEVGNREVKAATAVQEVAVNSAALASGEAAIASQRAEIESIRTTLAQTVVRAPRSGIVEKKLGTVGDTASVGKPLYSIVEGDELALVLNPTQAQLPRIEVGQSVIVNLETAGASAARSQSVSQRSPQSPSQFLLRGEVYAIEPALNAQSRQAVVKVSLPAAKRVQSGMFLSAEVVTGQRRSVAVAPTALIARPDGNSVVFTIAQQNGAVAQVQETVVDAIARADRLRPDFVEIRSGLNAGASVVVGGASYLQSGDWVTVVEESRSVSKAADTQTDP